MSRSGAGACTTPSVHAAAGIFRAARDDHAQSRRDPVEPLRDVLADHVQRFTAARADLALRLDDDLLARQMRGQVAAIGAAPFGAERLMTSCFFSAFASSAAQARLDVFQRQNRSARR